MKAIRPLFIAVLILSLASGMISCGEDKPPQKSSQQAGKAQPSPPGPQQSAQQNLPQQPQPAQAPSTITWLAAVADDPEMSLADNLLARNYYVVLDSSGSMSESKCSGATSKSVAAKTALSHFAQAVPGDANLGLAVFDGNGIAERVPLGSGNKERFITEVRATTPGNGTPLHDAALLGYRKLEEAGRHQAGYGEYHLVIVTDGEANTGQDPTSVVDQILKRSPVVIHTIGFCIGANHSLNQPGRTIYKAADNPGELRKGLEDVLAESPDFDVTAFKGN